MINKILRTLSIVLICIGSLLSFDESLAGYAIRGIGIILLTAGLVGAGLLLMTDIIRIKNHKVQLDQVRRIDYLAIFLWALAITLAINKSFVNHSIHRILGIERNLLVFTIVNWSIVVMFLIATCILAICLFKFNRSRNRQYSLRLVVPIICCTLLIPTVLTPIDSFSAGCPIKTIRLNLLGGGQQKIEALRKQAREKRELFNANHPGLSEGCSVEPLYVLYIL